MMREQARKTILFLCTGDTCRGPMAAGYLRKLLEDAGAQMEVRSAGVMTVNSLLATPETLQMLQGEGVDLQRHRSTPMNADLLRRADLILGMTPLHVQKALATEPSIRGRVFLLKEYTRTDLKKVQIDDPMGNTLEVYKKVFAEIKVACRKMLKTQIMHGVLPRAARAAASDGAGGAKKSAPRPAKASGKKTERKTAAKTGAKTARKTAKSASPGKKTARKSTAAKSTRRKTAPQASGARAGAAAQKSSAAKKQTTTRKKTAGRAK